MDRKKKKKMRGVFEASVIGTSHHQGPQCPKHEIN